MTKILLSITLVLSLLANFLYNQKVISLEENLSDRIDRVHYLASQIKKTKESKKRLVKAVQKKDFRKKDLKSQPQELRVRNIAKKVAKRKINKIEKFVNLDTSQKEELEQKFIEDFKGIETEELEDIIGESNYKFIQSQKKKSLERNLKINSEKDIIYLSSKLNLSKEKKRSLFELYEQIDIQVANQIKVENITDRFEKYKISMNLEYQLLVKGLEQILDQKEYQKMIKIDFLKKYQDAQIWH